MATTQTTSSLTVALVGNPNTGKSTLFSALVGVRQRIGNYPGVTVEKKTGNLEYNGQYFEVVDLPGTYSLAPKSLDEMVTVDVLLGRRQDVPLIDVVVSIIDASNLERNLYLVSQVLELGLPTVVALNMTDIALQRGIQLDLIKLRARLEIPVVELQANRRIGVKELKDALVSVSKIEPKVPTSPFPTAFQAELEHLDAVLAGPVSQPLPRYLVERLLLDSNGYLEQALLNSNKGMVHPQLRAARSRLSEAGCPIPGIEAISRYEWVAHVLEGVVGRPTERVVTQSDRIDRVLTHKFWGTLFFAVLMLLVFSAIFRGATPLMNWIDAAVGQFAALVNAAMPLGALRSLLVDGVIGGVGSVLIFLPQIMILFLFIAVLEDCGYMARAAYLMDKLMVQVGLSGKSFIPLLSSFACAIPGVMATRVIENRRDRLTTILIAPLMSCSARFPVYTVLIAAFIPNRRLLGGILDLQGLTLFGMYLTGILVAALVALVLKRTLLRGPTPAFVMELPSYKWPAGRLVVWRMLEEGWGFVYRAGTLILAVSIVIWAASYYPHDTLAIEKPFAAERSKIREQLNQSKLSIGTQDQLAERLTEIEHQIAARYQQQSVLGRLGKWIEPAVRPLGWDWRIGCAAIASFPAREVVMGALGVIYNLGGQIDVTSTSDQNRLIERLRSARWDDNGRLVYNIPVALSIMVFFALCAQCASTLAVIRRETHSWVWPAFTFGYMTVLAYLGAFLTYQIGCLFL